MSRPFSLVTTYCATEWLLVPYTPITLEIRAEFFFGHLQWFRDLRRFPDLHRIVLAQRMTVPVFRHQQPPEVRVAVERDAEEIPYLPLEPVGRRPDVADRREMRVASVEADLQSKPRPVFERYQQIHDLEARLARPVIRGSQLRQQRKVQFRPLAQRTRHVRQVLARRIDRR